MVKISATPKKWSCDRIFGVILILMRTLFIYALIYSEKVVRCPFFRNSICRYRDLLLILYSEKLVHVP